MNITLPPELEHFIHANVRSGRHNSANEVVHEALRLLEQRDALRHRMDRALAESAHSAGTDGEAFLQAMLDDLSVPQKSQEPPTSE